MTQLENTLFLDFYGTSVSVLTDKMELLVRLKKDFSFFIKKTPPKVIDFKIEARYEAESSLSIPSHFKIVRKSKNSITYNYKEKRYNDYFGKLLSFYDYKNEEAVLSSSFLERLHEVTYLLILSRVGKKMDLEGQHKIHAFGVIHKGICCLGMMEMGVGKSTLMLELLKNQEVSILSDDTPLVTPKGILAFPLRVGLSELSLDFDFKDKEENIYSLEREEYGLKKLASIKAFDNPIGGSYRKLLLVEGFRGGFKEPRLVKSSALRAWVSLQKHMVIGIGLPLIFEYFWEYGPIDFWRKTKIFILRQIAAIRLAKQSEHYKFYMSNNPQENADYLVKELERASEISS